MIYGIINFDKPEGITSHDAVAIVRRLLKTKKVGHGGTLDPMATGVLPIFIGKATRIIEYMNEKDDPNAKEYLCEMTLGIETDTEDITGEIVSKAKKYTPPSEELLRKTLKTFEGEIMQTPPAYSAVKIDGRKLYEYARKGIEVPGGGPTCRNVRVADIELTGYTPNKRLATFRIACSGGTYVRTICADVGHALGCGAVMSNLRRIKSGPFKIEDSIGRAELESAVENDRLKLLPPETALANLEHVELKHEDAKKFCMGQKLTIFKEIDNAVAVFEEGKLIGIGSISRKILSPKKVLV